MSQPVKLSDDLVLEARKTAQAAERSIAGQIEFWAQLGRAIEPLLDGQRALALKESGKQKPISTLLASTELVEGKRRVQDYLSKRPYPHYEVSRDKPGLLVRIDESGNRTLGKFVNRVFQPLEEDGDSPPTLGRRKGRGR